MGLKSTHVTSLWASALCALLLLAGLAVAPVHAQSQPDEPPAEPVAARVDALAPASVPGTATDPEAYFAERPKPAAVVTLAAAGVLIVLLVAAGILLIARGLRDDLRDRKRSYRRRSRRILERSQRPPVAPPA
jgi:uncharacterized iron-regulated membrane protein